MGPISQGGCEWNAVSTSNGAWCTGSSHHPLPPWSLLSSPSPSVRFSLVLVLSQAFVLSLPSFHKLFAHVVPLGHSFFPLRKTHPGGTEPRMSGGFSWGAP